MKYPVVHFVASKAISIVYTIIAVQTFRFNYLLLHPTMLRFLDCVTINAGLYSRSKHMFVQRIYCLVLRNARRIKQMLPWCPTTSQSSRHSLSTSHDQLQSSPIFFFIKL